MLNKMVNGQQVPCTAEEEAQIRTEWSANEATQAAETARQEAETFFKESALSKLTALGLTTSEVKALLGIK